MGACLLVALAIRWNEKRRRVTLEIPWMTLVGALHHLTFLN